MASNPNVRIRGGDKAESRLQSLIDKLGKKKRVVRIGFLGGTYPSGIPIAAVAAFQDFGTRRIPPRPFFRNMIAAKKGAWPRETRAILKETDYDVKRTLGLLGEHVKGQLIESIDNTNTPPLAASTIRRKGFSKPLVETGTMRSHADYEVVD